MKDNEYIPKFPTKEAIAALSKRLNLPYHNNMQDWEYEVADATRIDEFLEDYLHNQTLDEEKFVLMEILLESFTEIGDLDNDSRWAIVLLLLEKNINIHAHTICYWSNGDELLENSWNVTPFVRKIFDQYNLKILTLLR
ncbi:MULTISPECIES: hypothetical protein [unclassified Acinetobacter]|uniref:hypothetical protein n=1 Tax=unclassified Acinetobacter TaxID=196816 RepID=UPI0024470E28|nr:MULTISPECIES: hypothetical protein [unclassified Acinetobacter]MDH0031949.1 hypothetical protein [Acinetobacter sp. GD04021]MDH0887358.1 hypothetical protein [Acinetobacter sp. GD03873]MDH1083953.1 hypothetical protein [Acinetobacter sp. GD03983]MDH2190674.1 hypothetical protein [Acinetobacter sp. GD03645]MDH2202164.1 hypothetical protein [Acinetobacter sp. GD03647]